MDKKLYEIFTILSPSLDEARVNSFAQDLVDFLSGQEGEVKNKNIKINERLAYPIKKNFNGHVVKIDVLISAEKDIAKLVKEHTRTNENILRLLCIIRPEIEEREITVIDQIRKQARKKCFTCGFS